jgi:antitoxin component of RelBE/YafQ-DinJ toxin-antitoxin module
MENKTARLTVLIDPTRKDAFEKLCHAQDMTPSQVMRRLIREFLDENGIKPVTATRKKAK